MTMNNFIRYVAGRGPAQPPEPAQPTVDLAKVEALVDKGLSYADAIELVRGPKPTVVLPPGNAGAGNNKPPSIMVKMNDWIRRKSGHSVG